MLACLRVFPVRDQLPGVETWLIIRKDEGENITKYQLSNATADTSIERLGQMSCSRYWIERALEDAKGEAGMADYQVRGWTGWHHHMVMTCLLYTSDAADDLLCVDLGGRRIIKKKKKRYQHR